MICIEENKCNLCGICVDLCESGAIHLKEGKVYIKEDLCLFCYRCINCCPLNVFEFSPMPSLKDVSYSALIISNSINSAEQLLQCAENFLEKNISEWKIILIIINSNELIDLKDSLYRVDEIYVLEVGEEFNIALDSQLILPKLIELIKKVKPYIILLPSYKELKPLAGRLAASFSSGFTTDCQTILLKKNNNWEIEKVKPAGENYTATIITPKHRPIIASLLTGFSSSCILEKNTKVGKLKKEKLKYNVKNIRSVEKVEEKIEKEAKVVVCAGMGIRDKSNLGMLEELAELLGGSLCATRPVVELGWLPKSYLVGQSGRIISPELYIGCGVSGALPHMLGIMQAKCIVAINKDKEAPIFNYAHYGVIADIQDFIPTLIKEIKNTKK